MLVRTSIVAKQPKLLQAKSLSNEWLGSSYYEDNSQKAGSPVSGMDC